jgi:hypothetical protein
MKLYIAVLDEFPDYMTPTLVAHSVLGAHLHFTELANNDARHPDNYYGWLVGSFKKCVVRVNQKEFDHIAAIPHTYLGYEKHTLEGRMSCAIPLPVPNDQLPNVLKFAKLWKPISQSSADLHHI